MKSKKTKTKTPLGKQFMDAGELGGLRRIGDDGAKLTQEIYAVNKIRTHMKSSGYTVLDVCCGDPLVLYYLKSAGIEPTMYVGVDLRSEGLKKARRLCPKSFIGLKTNAQHIDEITDQFNFVIFNEGLEHMASLNGRTLLRKIFARVEKGGYLILTTPEDLPLAPLDMKKEYNELGHVYCWQRKELEDCLFSIGFEVVESEYGKYCNSVYGFDDIVEKANWEKEVIPLVLWMEKQYGKTLTTYILAGYFSKEAGHIKMLLRKP